MGEGLAAHVVSNMYGNGEGNTVKHYYDRGSKPKTKTKKKGHKMSKQTKQQLKVVGLVTGIFAYVIGAVIVDLPSLTWSDVVSLAYFGIGGGLLFWLIGNSIK